MSMSGVLCDGKIVTFGGVLSGKGCSSVHTLDLGEQNLMWDITLGRNFLNLATSRDKNFADSNTN